MLQLSGRPYSCWRCLSRSQGRHVATKLPRSHATGHSRLAFQTLQRHWASTINLPPTLERYGQSNIPKSVPGQDSVDQDEKTLPIREQLRSWTAQHGQGTPSTMPQDSFIHGSVANCLSRTQSTGSSEMDHLVSTQGGMTDESHGGLGNQDAEVAIVGVGSRNPGDLVELRQAGSRVPLFAIYLGYFGDRNHFYAVNGRWITSMGFSSLFIVSKFASVNELAPVLARMPLNASPEQFDELRREDRGPSREDGARLIQKMTDFRLRAESVYQANLGKLDAVRTLLSNQRHVKYLSLFEIAEMLLPPSLKDGNHFQPPALYAIHTALYRNEIGFRPLSPSSDCHRQDHLFEVFPHSHTNIINKVAVMVRDYSDKSSKLLRPLNPDELEETVLGKFILQAREAVWASRSKREWTPHGILRASTGVRLPQMQWSQASKDIISFLEWWTSYDLFDHGSRFHGYGALILRALQVYDENAALDQSTAWTLLQEIGVIPPWEIPSRYKVRFPSVTITRGGGLERELPKDLEKSRRPDLAAGFRLERTEATIFCIDAPSTIVIDDGISLERTDKPGEFWVHVHAADPASCIKPNSDLGKFMELIPENIYLPGHFQAMLPSDLGEEESKDFESEGLVKQFSLRSGSPALTFSAKVNEAGDLLDFKVEPTKLGNVVYLDPTDVSEFCDEPAPPPVPEYSLAVGSPFGNEPESANRPMVAAKDLDQSSKDDLVVLYQLAEAIRKKRLAKGAWPYFFPRPSVSVSFQDSVDEGKPNEDSLVLPADPYIKVGYENSMGCSVVSNFMVLAGEIAARWCSSRGIPIPYRKDAQSSPYSLAQAFEYATKEIYPSIHKGIEPSQSQRQELSRHTGGIEISSQPGHYFLLGLDMYAKATSPLRRFSDLLVHWQIHAALQHEREIQRPIDPSTDDLDNILPFSSTQLSNTIPLLQMREKMGRTISRGIQEWILIALVRAWRFENSAPRTMLFTVSTRWRQGFVGRVNLFGLNAAMDIVGLNGCALVKDVQVGDQFEVELTDVNVHSRQILVKALRHLSADSASSSASPT